MGDLYFDLYLGARRFWGLILYSLSQKEAETQSLFAMEVDQSKVEELPILNIHQSSLSVVELCTAIAGLIIQRLGIKNEEGQSELDYYRQIFKKRRIPKKIWNEVREIFGVEKEEAQTLIDFLKLPDQTLYLAASANISEEEVHSISGLGEREQLAEIQKIFAERESGAATEEILDDAQQKPEEDDATHQMTNLIWQWFEVSMERGTEKDLLDVAELLYEKADDEYQLEQIARRLINLARDIRITKTRM